jgi:hypothetical protein
MGAAAVANTFKLWAASKGYVTKNKFSVDCDDAIAKGDFSALEPASETALGLFHNRGVLFVGFNEADEKVIVYTQKRLSKRDLTKLPQRIDNVSFVYKQGGFGVAGGSPGLPFSGGPYTLRGGFYTCGSSVNPANSIGAGTLGCLVKDKNNDLYGLSANHVVGGCNFSQPGLPILAPGTVDVAAGHLDPFTIGHHVGCLPMTDGLPQIVDVSENTDAALVRIINPNTVSSMQRDAFDTPSVVQPMAAGQAVSKVGRSSGLTSGVVECQIAGSEYVTFQVSVTNSTKVVFFDSLFLIRGDGRMFAEAGDSGSLVVANLAGNQVAVGIVIAVNEQKGVTYALPLDRMLRGFNVGLVAGHNV